MTAATGPAPGPLVHASLGVAALLLVHLYLRGGPCRRPLFCVGAFFVFFAFGPVVNLVLGNEVYPGIRLDQVGSACAGFVLALAGLSLACEVDRRHPAPVPTAPVAVRLYDLLPVVLVVLIAYGAAVIVVAGPAAVGGSKLDQVALAGPLHRIYLLVQTCAVSTFFLARRFGLARPLWWGNAATYVGYCLVTAERDFLLVLFSLVLHRDHLNGPGRGSSRASALAAAAAVLLGAVLFAFRDSGRVDVAAVLNQGSILFVDTFVMGLVPDHLGHRWGATYLQTVTGLLPAWLHDPGAAPLNQWLVEQYAPASTSGYGFSLTAEAYLNFGLAGVLPLFLVVGLGLLHLLRRAGGSDAGTFFSVYVTSVLLYALRGDSAQLVKSVLYGSVFFLTLHLLTTCVEIRGRRHPVLVTERGTPTRSSDSRPSI